MDTSLASTFAQLLASKEEEGIQEICHRVRENYEAAGQGHVFQWVDHLQQEERLALFQQLASYDPFALNAKYQTIIRNQANKHNTKAEVTPPREVVKTAADPERRKRWEEIGYAKLAQGKVAALVLAGGQGTRFAVYEPKGTVDIGLLSHKSLFQIQAERILKTQQLTAQATGTSVAIKWYILTSQDTDEKTKQFFRSNNFFGLDPQNVKFFMQGNLPCLSPDGKIIMECNNKMATAPDGNGGTYEALEREGILTDMKENGIEYLFQYCVDNILIRMLDPAFIGFLYESEADCGVKVAPKAAPEEPVGVLCLRDGKCGVIEYSEIDKEMAARRDEKTGELVFNAAHLCINAFRLDFLEKAAAIYSKSLPYHVALKKIPCADEKGNAVMPDAPNGWKLEQFVFDVFQYAQKVVAFEIVRQEEFSPLKNSAGFGKDCPETCRADLSRLHKSWIKKAGGKFMNEEDESSLSLFELSEKSRLCEISPLVSCAGEGLKELVYGREFSLPFYLAPLPQQTNS
jgi:UDP-N-acetylglucosamine pyrophosphorylase